jgi:CheY-like chemotaxis protein
MRQIFDIDFGGGHAGRGKVLRESRMIAAMPTILIADDDAVSLRFLQTTLESLGCEAIATADGAGAIGALASTAVDLLLLDVHMPDIGGSDLLQAVRELHVRAPAIATSADLDATADAALRKAGFAGTLVKPASIETIETLLRRHVGLSPRDLPERTDIAGAPAATAVLDDASALAAIGGDRAAMHALRTLFARELDELERDLATLTAAREATNLRDRLHRLRASSGFCGALALAGAALRLQRALAGDVTGLPDAIAAFLQTCRATRHALAPQP